MLYNGVLWSRHIEFEAFYYDLGNFVQPRRALLLRTEVSITRAERLKQAFFLTRAAEKTKTQAQNSSQKLKEKTQPQGGTFLLLRETQEKNSILPKKF